jgi:hypothetical protein
MRDVSLDVAEQAHDSRHVSMLDRRFHATMVATRQLACKLSVLDTTLVSSATARGCP